ncbi:MAG: hypothetical protein ABFR82_16125 [Nitrospirota bacterium]
MRRIREIIIDIRHRYPNDDFFCDFEYSCRIEPTKKKNYLAYNKALMVLDEESWEILKNKASKHFLDHREGQRKQGFFNQLNEAFAYQYLVVKGFKNVRFVKEGNGISPDISFTNQRNEQSYCEVKTLGISNNEINRRSTQAVYDGSVFVRMNEGFLNKFRDDVTQAWEQIHSLGEKGLVFIIIRFDDITLDYYQDYRKQLIRFCKDQGFQDLFIKIGLLGKRRISMTSDFK